MAVTAEDATDTTLAQLNTAKKNVEDIKTKIAVYGDTITAWDFIAYHAKQHNDIDALNNINTNFKDVVDPTSDESIDTLQKSIQYISDINTLRSTSKLNTLKISDAYMIEANYKVTASTPTPSPTASSSAASSASPSPSSNTASTVSSVTENIPTDTVTVLSSNMSLTDVTSIGIHADELKNQYDILLGSDTVEYDPKEYQTELSAFISENITAYKDALTALDAAQKAYDAAVAQKTADEQAAAAAAIQATAKTLTVSKLAVQNYPTTTDVNQAQGIPMYRLYNPNDGQHLYTKDKGENDSLSSIGWRAEGIGWYAPTTSSTPVYRLYNPNSGDHHYTKEKWENDWLVTLGWRAEGIGWYSDDNKGVPLYRQFNPNVRVGTHNYTKEQWENDWLVTLGWKAEGIGWYGIKNTVYMQGVDISEHNGDIDLTKYTNGFVIIRAGWWTNMDQKFLRNVQECERLGIPYGIYVYSYALDTEQATREANYTLELLKQCHPTLGVWYDMEDADGWKERQNANFTEGSLVSDICRTYCSIVKNAGYHVGIYASYSWFKNYISGCDEYDKWLAFWGMNDGSFNDMSSFGASIHQYTSTPLDRDVTYIDISHFSK